MELGLGPLQVIVLRTNAQVRRAVVCGGRSLGSAFVALSMLAAGLHAGWGQVQAGEPELPGQVVRLLITIKAREFRPSPVTVPVGRRVELVFHNQDAELHAVVPKRLLEGVPLHVDGNGATQFGEKGLERVLIPSGGREEIQFVPTAVGTFEYRCDLPGHQMVGKIVVEQQPAGPRAVVEAAPQAQGQR
ncbi:cupredoxin domain-containing protein [Nitrospira sp. Kam-Ns4a]